jgi:hypothetical protein
MPAPSESIINELKNLLQNDPRQTGKVYRAMESGLLSNQEIVNTGAGANTWAVKNNKTVINSFLTGENPKSMHIARQAKSFCTYFLDIETLSEGARIYIEEFKKNMSDLYSSEFAKTEQIIEVEKISKNLEEKIENTEGVYVYSYPHYIVHPNDPETDRCWYKIGSTTDAVWKRVKEQSRQTSMPEDPSILRIYTSNKMKPSELESLFHRILDAALHDRASARYSKSGKEWFNTTLEFLDVIADEFDISTVNPSE